MSVSAVKTNADQCGTGIAGLDDILRGGIPRNRLYVITGAPGVGKTTLAMQFLLEGSKQGEKVLYVTLSETKEEILSVAKSHGWNLENISILEVSAIEQQLMAESHNSLFPPSEFELNQTVELLLKKVEEVKPSRLVFDSLSEIRLLTQEAFRYRRQILALKNYFCGRQCTVFLLDDKSWNEGDAQIQSIAHGVIDLEALTPEYGIDRRRLKVTKLRGVEFRGGNHDYLIRKGGLEVYPRLIAAEHLKEFKEDPVSSNVKELDTLVGGGLDRGTSNLFVGAAGTGKSTLAMIYACAAAERGENVIFYHFEETIGTFVFRAKKLGVPIEKYLESGRIKCVHVDPAELTPGELTHNIRKSVEKDNVRMVVIDSVLGYLNAMPEERFLNLQLRELLTYLNQQGVLTILILTQHGILGDMQSSIDLSYLADTILLVRYFEFHGQLKKALSVVKKRSGAHENSIREFQIMPGKGVYVGQPLKDFRGIFKGVPTFYGAEDSMLGDKD